MSTNDAIVWSRESFLTWSDFKAEPNSATYEDSHSSIKYRYTWTVDSDKVENQVVFLIENINIFTELHSFLSWVRMNQANNALLKHEQGHFDLAEMIKRDHLKKIQNIFYNKHFPTRGQNGEQRKQFAKEDSGKMIGREIENLERLLSQKRQEYDEKTEYGQNTEKQSEYDSMFKELRL